ncbi:MAG: ACP S-malonyltransferase [Kamptonema sp. SIO4C4]|nr:ACP S-malonyltransferase [Kamptonema sp. SIO4C4]
MTKTAWVFPGQGSQKVGMQADLAENAAAKSKFDQAQEILGWSVLEVCQSDDDKLSRTLYTQPSLYVIEAILADLLLDNGQTPHVVAGHSLGEYVALYAARVFDFAAGLKLVQRRAELMDQAEGGKMVALIGFDREQLQTAIDKDPNVVLANDNSKAQAVISGTPDAVEQVVSQIKTKRAVPLNVSGAFHSPLMQDASAQFKGVLDSVAFAEAKIPVVSNVNPTPSQDAAELKARLVQQMTGSVRWREIMDQMAADGVEQVVEVGPGQVLAGLFKRSQSSITRKGVSCAADVDS